MLQINIPLPPRLEKLKPRECLPRKHRQRKEQFRTCQTHPQALPPPLLLIERGDTRYQSTGPELLALGYYTILAAQV